MLRPILRDWWERHGRPVDGLVFPSRLVFPASSWHSAGVTRSPSRR